MSCEAQNGMTSGLGVQALKIPTGKTATSMSQDMAATGSEGGQLYSSCVPLCAMMHAF